MVDLYGMITTDRLNPQSIVTRCNYMAGLPNPEGGAFLRVVYDRKVYEMMTEAGHFSQLCNVLEYAEADVG